MEKKLVERLFNSRFAGYLNRVIGVAADVHVPGLLLRPIINAYILGLGVDETEFSEPPGGFACFGDFFARHLKPGARPVCEDLDAMVSPADGELVGFGEVTDGAESTFTIKRDTYNIDRLLREQDASRRYSGGGFMVIYLRPRDYHRVHSAVDGDLWNVRHIPGARFSVAPWSAKRIDGIYEKNERMVFDFALAGGGAASLVMVAAFGVANIETKYAPPFGRDFPTAREIDPAISIGKGDELGAFRLGSTVVLLWTAGAAKIDEGLKTGRVSQGQSMGTMGVRGKRKRGSKNLK